MSEISQAWAELMSELDSRAPASRADIRPGNSGGADLVERELGISLSGELREWFSLHDASGLRFDTVLLPEAVIMSPREAADDSRMIRDIWAENDAEWDGGQERDTENSAGQVAHTWLPEYVMVGSDGCGGGLFVDTRSGPQQGCVRWWDKTEADDDYGDGPIASSLSQLLRAVLASVRSGRPVVHGLAARIRDERLEWAPADDARPL